MGLRFVGLLPCAVLPWAPKAPKAATLIRRIRPTTAPYRVPAVALQSAPRTSNTNLQQQQQPQSQTDLNNCRCSSNTVTLPIQAPIAAVASIPTAQPILTPAVQPIVTPAVQQQPTTSRQPTSSTSNPTTSPMLLVPFSAVPAANCGTFVPIQQHSGAPPSQQQQQQQPPPGATQHNMLNGMVQASQVPTPNNIVNGNGNVNNKVRQILYN